MMLAFRGADRPPDPAPRLDRFSRLCSIVANGRVCPDEHENESSGGKCEGSICHYHGGRPGRKILAFKPRKDAQTTALIARGPFAAAASGRPGVAAGPSQKRPDHYQRSAGAGGAQAIAQS